MSDLRLVKSLVDALMKVTPEPEKSEILAHVATLKEFYKDESFKRALIVFSLELKDEESGAESFGELLKQLKK